MSRFAREAATRDLRRSRIVAVAITALGFSVAGLNFGISGFLGGAVLGIVVGDFLTGARPESGGRTGGLLRRASQKEHERTSRKTYRLPDSGVTVRVLGKVGPDTAFVEFDWGISGVSLSQNQVPLLSFSLHLQDGFEVERLDSGSLEARVRTTELAEVNDRVERILRELDESMASELRDETRTHESVRSSLDRLGLEHFKTERGQ
ncbi:hypothetical protein [Haloarchaeobius sp. HRN-SO-5]|uniref:hypothetical protein n=1 Tax=Haloarchaeobius sp. HRN-SO-5 TaxID=3446118 RepID=UPI003EB6B12D